MHEVSRHSLIYERAFMPLDNFHSCSIVDANLGEHCLHSIVSQIFALANRSKKLLVGVMLTNKISAHQPGNQRLLEIIDVLMDSLRVVCL
ncbi:Unknown protein sequence [Pseudomonas amygdali pv. lachrymans]|uniref:Uncharacterized protein n=1 Tax=Pseudomonas amygdali pv. lachrymans TaxID=53707 RepID=A0ABR5KS60_PSEAV|nr:Unknown protein sequence [Pseudomonas amygdali pv. lachrymans]